MKKRYSKKEMKQILRQELEISVLIEQKIQDAYNQIRQRSGYQVSGKVRHGHFGRYAAVAAVMGLLGVSSATALAISGFFEKTVEEKGDTLSYEFQVNYELTPTVVTMEAGYIPEGYEQVETYKYDKEGYRQNGISLAVATADYLDVYQDSLNVDLVKNLEKTTINGAEAHLITIDYDQERVTRCFDKRIYLFHPEEGFVGIIYGGNDISMDELEKVAEGITYTKTEEPLVFLSEEEKAAKEESVRHSQENEQTILETGVPAEYVFQIGDTINPVLDYAEAYLALWKDTAPFGEEYKAKLQETKGIEITVKDVEILDSAKDLPKENFFDYDRVSGALNEDGSLKPYQRITLHTLENGEQEEIERTEAQRKFLKVTLEAVNLEDKTTEYWAGEAQLIYLTEREDGKFDYEEQWFEPLNDQEDNIEGDVGSPIYFDRSPYAGQMDPQFFYRDLEPGETLEYSLVFVVDEDRTDDLYLRFGTAYGEMDVENQIFHSRYVKLSR